MAKTRAKTSGAARRSTLEPWVRMRLGLQSSPLGPVPPGAPPLKPALRIHQAEALASTLLHACGNTSHYAATLTQAREMAEPLRQAARLSAATGGDEAETALRAVLAALPFCTPEELAAKPERFLAVRHDDVQGVISLPTSGSTGPGKRIYCAESDLEQSIGFFAYGMQGILEGPGRPSVALLMSGSRPGSVGHLFAQAMERMGVRCLVPGFPQDFDACMDALLNFSPSCLVGLPGDILSLARHRRAAALAASVSSVLFSGSGVSPALRDAVASGLACEVFQHYGLTEGGLAGAVECAVHDGLHSKELDWLIEIVDAKGNPLPVPGMGGLSRLPSGEVWSDFGEIVITTLTRQAMPLIRYRTGDLGRLSAVSCPCGSELARLRVKGRLGDAFSNRLSRSVLESMLLPLPWIDGVRIFRKQNEPALLLGIVAVGGIVEDAAAQVERALSRGLTPGAVPDFFLCTKAYSAALPGLVKQDMTVLTPEAFERLCQTHHIASPSAGLPPRTQPCIP